MAIAAVPIMIATGKCELFSRDMALLALLMILLFALVSYEEWKALEKRRRGPKL